jgi:hypothetical protein
MIVKSPVIEPSKEWLEKEKNERFNALFHSLWPNLYHNKDEKEKKEREAAELEKKKVICSLLMEQDLKKYEGILNTAKTQTTTTTTTTTYPMDKFFTTTSSSDKSSDTVNITINGLSSGQAKIEISAPHEKPPTEKPKTNVSSYDFPFDMSKYTEKFFKSSYNPEEISKGMFLFF